MLQDYLQLTKEVMLFFIFAIIPGLLILLISAGLVIVFIRLLMFLF